MSMALEKNSIFLFSKVNCQTEYVPYLSTSTVNNFEAAVDFVRQKRELIDKAYEENFDINRDQDWAKLLLLLLFF